MAKIAVMGDYDSIYGFAALGLAIFPADDPAEARKTLRRLAENDYGVIYVTEELAADPEFGLTEEQIRAGLQPEKYTGRCAEQVTLYLKKLQPLLADVAASEVEINV